MFVLTLLCATASASGFLAGCRHDAMCHAVPCAAVIDPGTTAAGWVFGCTPGQAAICLTHIAGTSSMAALAVLFACDLQPVATRQLCFGAHKCQCHRCLAMCFNRDDSWQ